ncbi:MAG: M28 family peptidase [Polyangiaceae bacterium]
MQIEPFEELVEELCSERCAGRASGTEGGRLAREVVVRALREAGLDPSEQAVPGCGGANVLASIPPNGVDRWVLVGAHFDHLGRGREGIFAGADDNAAAVAILVEVARSLVKARPDGRGVLFAAFDGEEPPHFSTDSMGSQAFVRAPTVPLDRLDMMICMDLVGHRFGPDALPDEVGESLFALGAERSAGTLAEVQRLATAEPSVRVRAADVEIIPPLSDYEPFWKARVPFLFLTAGRSRVYHTVEDRPELLDWKKMRATARWLERFVRTSCARSESPVEFVAHGSAHRETLAGLAQIVDALPALPPVRQARDAITELAAACDKDGRLPERAEARLRTLVMMLEQSLA